MIFCNDLTTGQRRGFGRSWGDLRRCRRLPGLPLPARVRNYREGLLDSFLAAGEYFWQAEEKGKLSFHAAERIDWDNEPEVPWELLSDRERLVAEALSKRGASFMQSLNNVLSGESPHETILSLIEKGIVCADSFVPVRQWLNHEKVKKAPIRQRLLSDCPGRRR